MRLFGAFVLMSAVYVAPVSGQTERESRAAIQVRARVIEALEVPTLTTSAATLAEAMEGSLIDFGGVGMLTLSNDALLQKLLGDVATRPGLVVNVVVLSPKGTVVNAQVDNSVMARMLQQPAIVSGAPGAPPAPPRSWAGYSVLITVTACDT